MPAKPFLDSNILVYVFTPSDPRHETAVSLTAAGGTISIQTLNEFANVARRKLRRDWTEIASALSLLRTLLDPPLPLTLELHEAALGIAGRYGFGIYDSLVVATALNAGCGTLYTEDLQDRQVIGPLIICNPFAPYPKIG